MSSPVRHPLLRTSIDEPPVVIAHRGASAQAPENTLPAFDLAWSAGARWVETDVQPSRDGVPVLLHDDQLERTTTGTGLLREADSTQLAGLDAGSWFGPAYAGTTIPTLQQLLDSVPADGHVLLEIKGPHTREELAGVLEVVESSAADERVLLQSFQRDALQELCALRPHRPVGLLTVQWEASAIELCAQYGAISYNPHFSQLHGREAQLRQLRESGISCVPWTVNEPADWAWLRTAGVDGIITDRPADLLAWLAKNDG